MKTAIVQYYIGGAVPEYVKISISKFEEYAKRYGCDYIFDTKPHLNPTNPFFEHLRILEDEVFEQYDRVLYVDVDIIPEVMDENIFNETIADIGAVPEFTYQGRLSPSGYDTPARQKIFKGGCEKFNIPIVQPKSVKSNQLMFNSGVLLWSREGILKAKETFMDWSKWNKEFTGPMALDQTYITGQIVAHLNYTELDYRWNCNPRVKFNETDMPPHMNFIHYTGKKKSLIPELYSA